MARYLLLSLTFLFVCTLASAQTSLQGKVTDTDSAEPIIYGNVAVFKEGVLVTGTDTDFDGNYSITGIDPGTYDVEASYVGYATNRVTGVLVAAGKANKLDIKLGTDAINLDVVVVTEYKVPLIEQDNTTSGGVVTAEQIRNLPTKDINALAASTAGLSSVDEGADVTIRGSRDNATDYYIDGVRVSGNLIPQSEIDQMQVITGGIGAEYGDVTGGIISITTKGPSSKFAGGVEVETSQFLDPYGYNLASLNLSGPILKNKNEESILGFRVSGQYLTRKDDDPPATGVYKVKDDVLADLTANPIRLVGSTPLPAAEFLTQDDVEFLDYQPNEESTRYDLTAKLDARLSKDIDVTLSGTYNLVEDRFTPGGGARTGTNWRLLNSHNNPEDSNVRYRGNFRFRHRLGGNGNALAGEEATDEEKAAKGSLIKNAIYTLQMGYEKNQYEVSDYNLKDEIFKYGHVGNFGYDWNPTTQIIVDPNAPLGVREEHVDYQQVFTGYTPAQGYNEGLVNYNNFVGEGANVAQYAIVNGFFRDVFRSAWELHRNVNEIYNLYRKRDNDTYTFNANSSFELLPGGSEKGRHNIQFGILYEQRVNRGYDIAPRAIWQVAQQQANRHIQGVDSTSIIGTFVGPFLGEEIPLFGTQIAEFEQNSFYKKVREVTGQSLTEYVNVDGLSPDQLSLDMFSAQELTDVSDVGLSYWGFDYLGNKLSGDATFDDFFTDKDENGLRTFTVAPNRPIYAAAFIQDKFTFRDIIFRVGVRVDRYDANTKVLKDPYSLYDITSAKDFYDQNPDDERPGTIGDDFKVYVTGPGSNQVKAFRDEDTWYFANGTQANDGNVIFGGQVVTPKLVNPDASIKSDGFDTSNSFEDYKPQINWMPRLAFSFPISDEANFFAHYDILVQRPPSNSLATALDYYYFTEDTPENNPNLRPERTIDYEVGFQQKISQSSALKIAAYYKELRDMIQLRTYLFIPAPVSSYTTFSNVDFGTVKGFTFQYDLRRTGNITFNANYTLQFADGTGSNSESQRGLTDRGNIRNLFPLSFDERHRFVSSIDYRYRSGKKYNGPRWFGADVFANAGANLQVIAVSGRPYTQKIRPQVLDGTGTIGQINGSRLPWNFTMNLRLDKSFSLTKPGAKRPLDLNIYFRVQNLLDARNVLGVYPASGDADDDGFLTSPVGEEFLEQTAASGRDVLDYTNSYQWRMLNPNLYSLPRRIFLGAIFEF